MWIIALASFALLACAIFFLVQLSTGSTRKATIVLSAVILVGGVAVAAKQLMLSNPVIGGQENPVCSGDDCPPANPGAAQ